MKRKSFPLPPGWTRDIPAVTPARQHADIDYIASNTGSYERVKRKYAAAFIPISEAIGEVANLTGISSEVLVTKMARGRPSGAAVTIGEARQILAWFLSETTTLNQREVGAIIGMQTTSVNRAISEVKRLTISPEQIVWMVKLGYNGKPWLRQFDSLPGGKKK